MSGENVTIWHGHTIPNNTDLCTIGTCPLDLAYVHYIPTLAGNSLYLAIFALLLCFQVGFGIWHRTWGFLVGMIGGLVLEIVGYAGRVEMHFNPFPFSRFLQYLICLTIAPAFLSAAIYLCLARIITIYGEEHSRFKPRTYTFTFISCDFLSLVLQAAGGGITATANDGDDSGQQAGIDVMLVGLSLQVASLAIFMFLAGDFALRVRKSMRQGTYVQPDASLRALQSSFLWRGFLYGLFIATITIFIRSIFRCAELSGGFDGSLANNEVSFMILEGAMIVIACTCLTAFHPGVSFKGNWAKGNFALKGTLVRKGHSLGSQSSSVELKAGEMKNVPRQSV